MFTTSSKNASLGGHVLLHHAHIVHTCAMDVLRYIYIYIFISGFRHSAHPCLSQLPAKYIAYVILSRCRCMGVAQSYCNKLLVLHPTLMILGGQGSIIL